MRLPTEAEWEKAARGGLPIPKARVYRAGDKLFPEPIVDERENPLPHRVYPWEGEFDAARLNCAETRINTTSAVGAFPGGVSPYGALDLSGNVWEWCLTQWVDNYADYDKITQLDNPEGDARRVVRGGAFYNVQDCARCAYRDYRYSRTTVTAIRGSGWWWSHLNSDSPARRAGNSDLWGSGGAAPSGNCFVNLSRRRVMARQEMPIFTRTFDFLTWLLPATNHFPRAHRFTFTQRLLDAAFDLRERLEEANYRRGAERLERLDRADEALGKIRLYLRLAVRWEWLAAGQYRHAAGMVAEIGRLLGGWRKQTVKAA